MSRFRDWWHCPHSDLSPIYGDEIIHVGWFRLQCRQCGRFLNGPVRLAEMRRGETTDPVEPTP